MYWFWFIRFRWNFGNVLFIIFIIFIVFIITSVVFSVFSVLNFKFKAVQRDFTCYFGLQAYQKRICISLVHYYGLEAYQKRIRISLVLYIILNLRHIPETNTYKFGTLFWTWGIPKTNTYKFGTYRIIELIE